MAVHTTVYDAKVALKALLEGHAWDDPAPAILWGVPTENEDITFDGIFFGNQPEFVLAHRVLGRRRIDEEYRLQVVVDVRRFGDDEQATELRMWQLFDVVIDILHENNTLGGAVNRMSDYTVRPGNIPAGQSWHSQVVVDIGVVGLIRP